MAARNARPGATPRNGCDRERLEGRGPVCLSVVGSAINRLSERLIFQAVEPTSLELSLRAAEQAEGEGGPPLPLEAEAGEDRVRVRAGQAALPGPGHHESFGTHVFRHMTAERMRAVGHNHTWCV